MVFNYTLFYYIIIFLLLCVLYTALQWLHCVLQPPYNGIGTRWQCSIFYFYFHPRLAALRVIGDQYVAGHAPRTCILIVTARWLGEGDQFAVDNIVRPSMYTINSTCCTTECNKRLENCLTIARHVAWNIATAIISLAVVNSYRMEITRRRKIPKHNADDVRYRTLNHILFIGQSRILDEHLQCHTGQVAFSVRSPYWCIYGGYCASRWRNPNCNEFMAP